MLKETEWEDVTLWDEAAILRSAGALVQDAFTAREACLYRHASTCMTQALDMLGDVEDSYPEAVAALRAALERL